MFDFRRKYCILGIIALIFSVHQTFAENLEDVYQLAVKNDQAFQNATATRQATAEALPQAMATLFPQLSATANSTLTRQWTTNSSSTTNGLVKYNSNGYTVTATLPLININDWYTVRQANSTVKRADATYADAAQSLILRTAQAYFNVLQAEDNLRNTRAQKDLLAKQLQQSKARYEVGVDALTSVYNAQSAYDSAAAQEISNENTLYTAYQNLAVITGQPIDHLSRLIDNLPLQQPNPTDISAWQKAAENHNFSLLSYRYAAQAAREGVALNQANHLPTLSATGSYAYTNENPNVVNVNGENQTVSTAGFQVSVPLFAGGQVMSQTRQAQDQLVQAETTLELQHRQILAQTYQTYTSILAGIKKIEADRAAIRSANSALQSNQASYQAGTMTIVDVLQAVNNLYAAQQTFTADQYAYLTNTFTLKQLAGNLTNLDVSAINRWLTNGVTTSANLVNQQALRVEKK